MKHDIQSGTAFETTKGLLHHPKFHGLGSTDGLKWEQSSYTASLKAFRFLTMQTLYTVVS